MLNCMSDKTIYIVEISMVPIIKELTILLEEMPQMHHTGLNKQGLGQRMALGSKQPSSTLLGL